VSEGIYVQIFLSLRPQLMRKIKARRQALEVSKHEAQECQTLVPIEAPMPPPPKRRKQIAKPAAAPAAAPSPLLSKATQSFEQIHTPRRRIASAQNAPLPSQTSLMTQAAPPKVQEASQTDAWTCECSARLRRHPRCSAPGELQPKIVYISKETMVVGRLHTCDVVIDATTPQMISRRHAVLTTEAGDCKLVDQGALNGVIVNGERLQGERMLKHGDLVTFGPETLVPELEYIFEQRPGAA